MDENSKDAHFALYIGTLLFKSVDKKPLTEKERQDLEEWLNSHPRRQEILQRSLDREALAEELKQMHARYNTRRAVNDLFDVLELQQPGAAPVSIRKRRFLFRLGAAAAVVLAVAAVWIFTQRQEKNKPIAAVEGQLNNDVQPGGDKAILTLSDGSSIVLDTARKGALTRQGGADVINNNGQLSYKSHDDGNVVVYNTMRTLRGGKYQLTLPDGSHVWLNAESSIRFPSAFTGARREIGITGEAYFEVASMLNAAGEKIPFVVKVHSPTGKDAEVQVLGTHFNIMAYGNESALETTLLEGSVIFNKGMDSILLKPGQQGRWSEMKHMQLVSNVDVEGVVAWKNGLQTFHKADIPTIMRHAERWYDVDVAYDGALPETLTFSGEVPSSVSLSQLLKVFETPALHFRIDGTGRKVTVIYRPKN